MGWLVKPQKIYLDLVASWLRSEIARLTHVLNTVENAGDYHDDFIHESIKATETGLRRIRKFTEAN
ncbi:MAG: hypothetical protein U9Q07_08825 [Planctomycetota bacterium]|nr:hypothetical protein [Planctomycetota bacterium]